MFCGQHSRVTPFSGQGFMIRMPHRAFLSAAQGGAEQTRDKERDFISCLQSCAVHLPRRPHQEGWHAHLGSVALSS